MQERDGEGKGEMVMRFGGQCDMMAMLGTPGLHVYAPRAVPQHQHQHQHQAPCMWVVVEGARGSEGGGLGLAS